MGKVRAAGRIGTGKTTPKRGTASRVPRLKFRPVDRGTWEDMVRLFESRGGPKHCWCMAWRPMRSEDRRGNGKRRKLAMRRRVSQGVPVGILGYVKDRPVAWCSIAPRSTYRPLGGQDAPGEHVWSLVCFFLARDMRKKGILNQMLRAAEIYARREGATLLEAYPVDANSPSYRFMGRTSVFAGAGYHEVGRAGTRRHVFHKSLRRRSGRKHEG